MYKMDKDVRGESYDKNCTTENGKCKKVFLL